MAYIAIDDNYADVCPGGMTVSKTYLTGWNSSAHVNINHPRCTAVQIVQSFPNPAAEMITDLY